MKRARFSEEQIIGVLIGDTLGFVPDSDAAELIQW
jgi:hypothetical protein